MWWRLSSPHLDHTWRSGCTLKRHLRNRVFGIRPPHLPGGQCFGVGFIEVSVIGAHSPLPIALFHQHNICQPNGVLNLSYNPASNDLCTLALATNLFSSPNLLLFCKTGLASFQTESLYDITQGSILDISLFVQANKSLLSIRIFFIFSISSSLKHTPKQIFGPFFPSCHSLTLSLGSTLILSLTQGSKFVITTMLWFTCHLEEVTVGVNIRLVA